MAIKDRISGIFKRGPKKQMDLGLPGAGLRTELTPQPADEEERRDLLRKLGDGFGSVAQVMERLDGHLEAGTRSLEGMTQTQNRLPGMLEGHRELIERTTSVAAKQADAIDALREHLQRRDEVQAGMLDSLREVELGLRALRDHDRSQLDLVLQFQRSGRRLVMLVIFGAGLLILALLSLLIVISLRPDLLGLQTSRDLSRGPSAPQAPIETSEEIRSSSKHQLTNLKGLPPRASDDDIP